MIELTCTLSEQIREYTLGTNPRVCYFINLRRCFLGVKIKRYNWSVSGGFFDWRIKTGKSLRIWGGA